MKMGTKAWLVSEVDSLRAQLETALAQVESLKKYNTETTAKAVKAEADLKWHRTMNEKLSNVLDNLSGKSLS